MFSIYLISVILSNKSLFLLIFFLFPKVTFMEFFRADFKYSISFFKSFLFIFKIIFNSLFSFSQLRPSNSSTKLLLARNKLLLRGFMYLLEAFTIIELMVFSSKSIFFK